MSPDPSNGKNQNEESARSHARAAREFASEARENAAAAAAEMRDAATEVADELRERFSTISEEIKGRAKNWQTEAEKYVRENPTKSIFTAVGVGFVLGVLFRR